MTGISHMSRADQRLSLGIPLELLTATDSLEQPGSSFEGEVANETRVERVEVRVIGRKAGLAAEE